MTELLNRPSITAHPGYPGLSWGGLSMSKEWVINSALNRWGLNRKKRIGATSEMIRAARPKTQAEWEDYYREHGIDDAELDAIAEELYAKREILRAEIEDIDLDSCRDYVRDVIFRRTFNGYQAERDVVAELLEHQIGATLKEAPDAWDRGYGVDWIVDVPGRPLGVQIKPPSFSEGPDAHRREAELRAAHLRFMDEANGTVVTIVYGDDGDGKKKIRNTESIATLQIEIERRRGG